MATTPTLQQPAAAKLAVASLPSPPLTPSSSRPPSPSLARDSAYYTPAVAFSQLPDASRNLNKWNLRIKELACHISLVVAGWADASSGPLIPYIQAHYKISYTVVSMMFVGQMVGFIAAGLMSSWLSTRFGLGKVIALGAAVQALGLVFLIPALPFPANPLAFAVSGWGMALQDAQANVYVATLPNAERKLSWLHASYGLGAAVCPLAATAFASSGILFARFYSVSLGLALSNTAFLSYAFRLNYVVDSSDPVERTVDVPGAPPITVNGAHDIELPERRSSTTAASLAGEKVDLADENEVGIVEPVELDTRFTRRNKVIKQSVLLQALTQRATYLSSLFLLLYVGAEVSMGGWVVTFLLENRDAGADAGYVATGFWFGLALGRLLLAPLNTFIGEKRAVYGYLATAMGLEFVIWFRDDLISNAVVVGLIGVLLGPLYPVSISILSRVLPRRLHAPSIAACAAFGQTGSALFPFITGALAQRHSPAVLQPVMVALMAGMLILWTLVPSPARKRD
ncbi:hypothetical protein JCM3775_006151 [Rhodotorula graminis]|uniref:Major facilitator superfamily (MFS) profile domain-containing protein n=1 Tax=Rhodotorula graminis (strain WP1) TaxID=578459 RepID=A0A194S1X3_RHOGW|nr:uncharacterized protein RHOBADRAFT_54322 [Rhodotorula graminis WP1]KPV74514.1 hypothetical protein RHOBADRAFT_54322 [Rhodotorula graminis WP1]